MLPDFGFFCGPDHFLEYAGSIYGLFWYDMKTHLATSPVKNVLKKKSFKKNPQKILKKNNFIAEPIERFKLYQFLIA